MPWKHRPVQGPPPVRTLQSQVFMSRRLGENFWPGIAAALLVRVSEVGCNWCQDSPSANCVESSCSMAHGGGNRGSFFEAIFGFGFCFPSFLSVLKLTPKSVSKIETIFGFRFLFAGWFLGTLYDAQRRPIFLLRRYIQFLPAHASKQSWLDFPQSTEPQTGFDIYASASEMLEEHRGGTGTGPQF